jgi:hypothetical protein
LAISSKMAEARMKDKSTLHTPAAPPGDSGDDFAPGAAVAATAVREQLERVLASSHFRNSKRYPALLRFVVERTLDGRSGELKERNVAVDVFGREPSYDPSVDPVVRISAGEVRKRLAQYYQEAGRESEIRIELPLGSYQPEFHPPAAPAAGSSEPTGERTEVRRWSYSRRLVVLLAAGLLVLAAILAVRSWKRPSALDLFWRPAVSPAGHVVMLCFGGSGTHFPSEPPTGISGGLRVPWWDAETLARLAGLIQAKGASLQLIREDRATFDDFQQAPAVLIGAFNDAWTLRLMEKMRFTFQREGAVCWIADRDRPAFRNWKIDMSQTDSQGRLLLKEDYAVISRVSNPRTGRITITVAGLYGYGTLAAGKFLTDSSYLESMSARAPSGWQDRNMQVVVGTEVIQENAGPPRILATAFW